MLLGPTDLFESSEDIMFWIKHNSQEWFDGHWIKHNSQEWFDGEIFEALKNCDKLLKKFKRSKSHINKELYNVPQYKVHKIIFNKEKDYFENKLNECIGKPEVM